MFGLGALEEVRSLTPAYCSISRPKTQVIVFSLEDEEWMKRDRSINLRASHPSAGSSKSSATGATGLRRILTALRSPGLWVFRDLPEWSFAPTILGPSPGLQTLSHLYPSPNL